jgi:hypothetical protein
MKSEWLVGMTSHSLLGVPYQETVQRSHKMVPPSLIDRGIFNTAAQHFI